MLLDTEGARALEQVYACAQFYSNLVQVVELGGMKHLVDRGLGVRSAAFEVLEALIVSDSGGNISELVEKDLSKFMTTVAQGLGPCGVTTVTLCYKMGPGNTDDVVIRPPNMKTQDPGGPAAGHAAFCEARVAEIAAVRLAIYQCCFILLLWNTILNHSFHCNIIR